MPPKPWKTLSTWIVYENPWTTIREDVAEMPNGKTTIYGVVQNAECVGVLPFVDDDHVVMVRQYRYVFWEDHRWEMPTGGVKPGEALEQAVRRELGEEIGMTPPIFSTSLPSTPANPSSARSRISSSGATSPACRPFPMKPSFSK